MNRITGPAAFAGILAAAACVIPIYVDDLGRFDRTAAVFRETVEFAPGRVLSVENGVGDITIRGWDGDDIEITAEEGWEESAGWNLGRNNLPPRVTIDRSEQGVRIQARPRETSLEDDRAVRLLIQVPHDVELRDVAGRRGRITVSDIYGRIRLDLEEGDVRVENFSGSIDADLVRGSMEAELLDIRSTDTVRLSLREGPASLGLESDFSGRIEADAPNGTLDCEFSVDPPAGRTKAAGKIGSGEGALIIVSTLRGDIRIRKIR